MESVKPFVLAGIGELLWDMFPEGKRLGGAPANFCYHGHQLGAEAYPVSAVGDDALGREIRDVLQTEAVSDRYVAVDPAHPTGTVQVTLEQGKPAYEICEGVAWDHIPMSDALIGLAGITDAVCFGSLAQRHDVSREAIHVFLDAMPEEAWKVFDVNLRQDFFTWEIIRNSLECSNLLKLSDEELPVLAELFGLSGGVQEQLHALQEKFALNLIAYTRGEKGSLLMRPGEQHDHPGCPGEAVNTVGAGDSFTATLTMGLLQQRPLGEINEHANRVASFVCTQDTATPTLPGELIRYAG